MSVTVTSSAHQIPSQFLTMGRIGRGSYGVVDRAIDRRTNKPVALKTSHGRDLFVDLEDARRIATEMALLASIRCPFIVRIVGAVRFRRGDRAVSFALEPAEMDLHRMLYEEPMLEPTLEAAPDAAADEALDEAAANGALAKVVADLRTDHRELDRLLCIFYQLLLALDHLHRRDIAHYDVTARNILIVRGGGVKLCDLGLAGPATRSTGRRVMLWNRAPEIHAAESTFAGATPHYGAPADVFAAGCVLVELLQYWLRTGRDRRGEPPVAGERRAPFADLEESMGLAETLEIITRVIGRPSAEDMAALGVLPLRPWGRADDCAPRGALGDILAGAPAGLVDVARSMLQLNPHKRPTCEQLLRCELFTGCPPVAQLVAQLSAAPHSAAQLCAAALSLAPIIECIASTATTQDTMEAMFEGITLTLSNLC